MRIVPGLCRHILSKPLAFYSTCNASISTGCGTDSNCQGSVNNRSSKEVRFRISLHSVSIVFYADKFFLWLGNIFFCFLNSNSLGFPESFEVLYQFFVFVRNKRFRPEIIQLEVTVSDVTESRNGPDKSHPNLLETAVGPESPRRVSPLTISQTKPCYACKSYFF